MKRSIAKFLIQYYYDSGSVSTKADRLPSWLRRWVVFDLRLGEYEHELLRLESKLVGQAGKHVTEEWAPRTEFESVVHTKSIRNRSVSRSPAAFVGLAASVAFVLLVGRLLDFGLTREDTVSEVVVNTDSNVKEGKAKAIAHERWILSTLSATKRLASKLNEKGSEAAGSLAIANQTLTQERELVKSAGLGGLRFVAQKLPAATVRMIGLNDRDRN